ncbi:hypothetical protein C0991_003303 [Blastosporella zonata]|nr:hypothetical protein C0991_003303 [Blastosporella zonata]
MSTPPSSPPSHDTLYAEDSPAMMLQRSPSNYPITRTVAIIKPHALEYRFEIEQRIQEASFEIVKERQMEFDTETDPDTLYELFGEDARSFSEGPVWVYVLERRRAVEVWTTLMGDADPAIARTSAPHSLRALFGKSPAQNGLMGSPDTQAAELQIASIFVSSPPFPTTDLPSDHEHDHHHYDSVRSVDSMTLAALRHAADEGYAASSATNPSTVGGSRLSVGGKPTFRARPIPATNAAPNIVPRTTRAASLRAGEVVEKKQSGPRSPLTKEQLRKTFANVPGHKRSETIAVASTAAPAIVPRMTRAASLRLGVEPLPPVARRRTLNPGELAATFEGVPGHKRRESIAVASVRAAPTVAPRLNKSAELRQQKEQGPPSSFMFRGATAPKLPGIARSTSMISLGSSTKSIGVASKSAPTPTSKPAPKPPSAPTPAPARPPRPASQVSQAPPRPPVKRPSSVLAARPSAAASDSTAADTKPAARPPRPSSVASLNHNPSIPPRTNRTAALRAAKQEAENLAAAAAAAKKKTPRVSRAPSSFKPIAV